MQNNPILQKVLYNLEAEQVLLGALLIDNERLQKIEDFIYEDHFYLSLHKEIFSYIKKYCNKDISINAITIQNLLNQNQELAEQGGSEYLIGLQNRGYALTNLVGIAKLIHDLYLKRCFVTICQEGVEEVHQSNEVLDAHEHIEHTEEKLFTLTERNTVNPIQPFIEHLKHTVQNIQYVHKNKSALNGLTTGFIDLDKLLGGMQKSDLLILAARPSMGKTSLAINIALNSCMELCKNSTANIAFFSLEMSVEQLVTRMLAMESRVDASKIRTGRTDEEENRKVMQAAQILQPLPLYIDDTPALSTADLRTRIRRLYRKHKLAAVFIDYLQLLRSSEKRREPNRVQEVSEITQSLKAIAKEMNIPVVALSQLSRAVEQREDKRPQLADLRESGSIEQDADVVMFIFRKAYYILRKKPAENTEEYKEWREKVDVMQEELKEAEIMIAKQRNGPIGNIKLFFDSDTTKFQNLVNYTDY